MSENRLAAKLTKVDKAAILLLSLGETDAAQVLRHMGPKEVQRVGVAMASMRNVHREQVEQVMGEFVEVVGDQTSLGVGADGYIRKMLTQALGEDKANNLIDRILLGGSTSGLDSLKWMEPRAVADVIRYEHPQIQAIVVAYLDPDQAAEVLSHFDHKVRLDIVLRVSSLNTVQPSALKELNLILEKQFAGNSNATRTTMGGVKRAADIMNYLDSSIEGQLMDSIREVDEDLSGQIEDLMFVFDNLAERHPGAAPGSLLGCAGAGAQGLRRGDPRESLQEHVQACRRTAARRPGGQGAGAGQRSGRCAEGNPHHCPAHGRVRRYRAGRQGWRGDDLKWSPTTRTKTIPAN